MFCYLAEQPRTGDVAVIGPEEYADWSRQLLRWKAVEVKLPQYLVDVGLRDKDNDRPFDAVLHPPSCEPS